MAEENNHKWPENFRASMLENCAKFSAELWAELSSQWRPVIEGLNKGLDKSSQMKWPEKGTEWATEKSHAHMAMVAIDLLLQHKLAPADMRPEHLRERRRHAHIRGDLNKYRGVVLGIITRQMISHAYAREHKTEMPRPAYVFPEDMDKFVYDLWLWNKYKKELPTERQNFIFFGAAVAKS